MVWARATAGDPFASVELMRIADDKAQALFDNCFEIVSGPDAPDVTIQELDKEVILMLTNDNPLSNNFQEGYSVFDPGTPSLRTDGTPLDTAARSTSSKATSCTKCSTRPSVPMSSRTPTEPASSRRWTSPTTSA